MDNSITMKDWLQNVIDSRSTAVNDSPNYWRECPKSLVSVSSIHNVALGTGCSIFTNSILPAVETAEAEVILVTCFWARSKSLDALIAALRKLSAKATRNRRRIRVRLCFSSSSLFQKLFHTSSLDGHTYSASELERRLGLPAPNKIQGLDVEVRSIFVLPFSVMHPKFVIVDRSRVVLPSCNVSWEDWFEGCILLSGPATEQFVNFWKTFWASERDRGLALNYTFGRELDKSAPISHKLYLLSSRELDSTGVPSIFLPSPHHRNPNFALPWRPCPPPPPTPLNLFLLSALSRARKEVYIQTPNLTAPPVLSALLGALTRGVNVTIVTSERLMILEQLVTAGTTTARCVKMLVKRYERLVKQSVVKDSAAAEAHPGKPGKLRISFYQAPQGVPKDANEPVQSHLKLTMIDGEWTIFGSGNMDRSSWYTSQELAVAFFSPELATTVRHEVDTSMRSRCSCWYGNEVS